MRNQSDDPPTTIDDEDYRVAFSAIPSIKSTRREKALEHALDIRKFEIEMYWKRATYFWTLIGASFAGYAAIQAAKEITNREHLSTVIAVSGLVLSFAWYCVNRGSKQWQENWENHVDLLEDDVIGPLYKTVIRRPAPGNVRETLARAICGPAPLSVTKINQVVSIYVTGMWVLLLWQGIGPIKRDLAPDVFIWFVLLAGTLACIGIVANGKTDRKNHKLSAERRTSVIISKSESEKK